MGKFLKTSIQSQPQAKGKESTTSNTSEDIPPLDDMSPNELKAAFEVVLDDMNLTDEKKEVLRKQSELQKRQLLDMNHRRTITIKSSNTTRYVNNLESRDLKPSKRLSLLQMVGVHLRSDTLPWIKSFGRHGFLIILDNIKILFKSGNYPALHEGVLCVSSFINSKYGMEEALEVEEFILILLQCLKVGDPNILVDLLKIIAAVCIYPHGHAKVLEGFSRLKKKEKLKFRFSQVVSVMCGSIPVQSMCFQLVNAIVSTPDDWELRQHLRCEFFRAGMAEIYPKLCESCNPEVKTHVDIFNNLLKDDAEEMGLRFDLFSSDFNSLDDSWTFLRQVVAGGPSEPHLLSIMHHLLFIRDDAYSQESYFSLLEAVVGQIVVQKGGVDPDPNYKIFNIDFELLTSTFATQIKKNHQAIAEIKEKYESKLSTALSAKMEAESKISLLEARLLELGDNRLNSSLLLARSPKEDSSSGSPKIDAKIPSPPLPIDAKIPPPPLPTDAKIPPPPLPIGGKIPPPPPPIGGKIPPPPLPIGGKLPPPPLAAKITAPPPIGGKTAGNIPPPSSLIAQNAETTVKPPLPHGMKKKKSFSSMGNTKRINWNKLKPEIFVKECLWVKASDDRFLDPQLLSSVKSFFATNAPQKIQMPAESIRRKVKQLRVIDSNASQAISILIANLRLTPEELKKEFMAVNCKKIQMSTLEQLLRLLPDDDSMSRFKDLSHEYEDLEDAEKYLFNLSQIQDLRTRVELMIFMQQYEESSAETKSSIASITEACTQMRESSKFADALEMILLIGNILNVNSRNSETYGFNLSILPKLFDTKSHDGSLTFLHFLIESMQRKCPKSVSFHLDLISVYKASIVCPQMINQSLNYYEKNISKIKKLIPNYVRQSKNDLFEKVFSNFFDLIWPQQELLREMKTRMDESYKKLMFYFGLPERALPSNQFFEAVNRFCMQFKDVLDEINTKKEMETKKISSDAQKSSSDAQKISSNTQKIKADNLKKDEGIMDSLVEALKSGSAFKHENRKKKNNEATKMNLSNLFKNKMRG